MPANMPPPLLLLLHDGGWDEAIMVAVGLAVAYLVIVWTGRKMRDDDEDDIDEMVGDGGGDVQASGEASGETPSDRAPRSRS